LGLIQIANEKIKALEKEFAERIAQTQESNTKVQGFQEILEGLEEEHKTEEENWFKWSLREFRQKLLLIFIIFVFHPFKHFRHCHTVAGFNTQCFGIGILARELHKPKKAIQKYKGFKRY
jgi:hypothetical protein